MSHPASRILQDPAHLCGLSLVEKLETPTDKARLRLSSYQTPWVGYPGEERADARQLDPF